MTEPRYRHVLLPLDGSEFAAAAVPTAQVLAERFGAELHGVSVAETPGEVEKLRSHVAAALGLPLARRRRCRFPGWWPANDSCRATGSPGVRRAQRVPGSRRTGDAEAGVGDDLQPFDGDAESAGLAQPVAAAVHPCERGVDVFDGVPGTAR